MTDLEVFLDAEVSLPTEIYLSELLDSTDIVILNEDLEAANSLLEIVDSTLSLLYLRDAAIEDMLLKIYKDAIEATRDPYFEDLYFYNFYGNLSVAENIPNLMLDLSHPYSQFLRTF